MGGARVVMAASGGWRCSWVTEQKQASKQHMVTQAEENGGRRFEQRATIHETLGQNLTHFAHISPYCGSFSLDRGGSSLIPNYLLISNVFMLNYMLVVMHVSMWDWLSIQLWFEYELGRNWVLWELNWAIGLVKCDLRWLIGTMIWGREFGYFVKHIFYGCGCACTYWELIWLCIYIGSRFGCWYIDVIMLTHEVNYGKLWGM